MSSCRKGGGGDRAEEKAADVREGITHANKAQKKQGRRKPALLVVSFVRELKQTQNYLRRMF